jgi:hypothetical protein
MTLLNQYADISADVDDFETSEARFSSWIGTENFRHSHHAADFVDFHWARLSLLGQASNSLRLWRRLVQVNDIKIVEFETQKQSLLDDPFVHLRFKVNMDRGQSPLAWTMTVGDFINSLIQRYGNSVFRDSCFPEIESVFHLHERLMQSPHLIPQFYQGILDKIELGVYEVPRENTAEHVSTLMHMTRITSSATAFLVVS